jgi:predicted ATPase
VVDFWDAAPSLPKGESMIERIQIENFKSFKKVDLKLGQMNLFIGTNASGKSNFFDALRVLRGIAGGYRIEDVFEGGGQKSTGDILPAVRGGLANALHQNSKQPGPEEVRLQVCLATALGGMDYEIGFDRRGAVTHENLVSAEKLIFTFDGKNAFFLSPPDPMVTPSSSAPFHGSQLLLGFLAGQAAQHRQAVETWRDHLVKIQFLSPDPELLRGYGRAADISRMGEHGEYFASLVRHICADATRKSAFLNWLRELRPEQIEDVGTLPGALNEPMFMLKENGRDFPALVLSDGTLRFAAITAAFFQPRLPEVLLLEEMENGIHASCLRLLLELVKSQSRRAQVQVIATTHSRSVLDWLEESDYATTFYCHRDTNEAESTILPLTEVPHLLEAAKEMSLGDLFAENWLEAAS